MNALPDPSQSVMYWCVESNSQRLCCETGSSAISDQQQRRRHDGRSTAPPSSSQLHTRAVRDDAIDSGGGADAPSLSRAAERRPGFEAAAAGDDAAATCETATRRCGGNATVVRPPPAARCEWAAASPPACERAVTWPVALSRWRLRRRLHRR
jgi:hypothetical protein